MRMLVTCAALALAGCATPYQSAGFRGGFNEVALAPNVYRVSFNGNGFTSSDRASDLAMLRSADLTIEKGFRYFAFVDSRNSVSRSYSVNPTYSSTDVQAQAFGNTISATANTTTYGGGVETIEKPRTTNVVAMFIERPALNGMVYDAQFICSSLGSKFKVQCGMK